MLRSVIKRFVFFTIAIALLLPVSQAFALGYTSRDCPQANAKEAFTMSWTVDEYLYVYASLLRKTNTSPSYRWESYNSGSGYHFGRRAAAGIHPYPYVNMDNYWAGVYSTHYYYNRSNRQSERRTKYIARSCDILNWAINNW